MVVSESVASRVIKHHGVIHAGLYRHGGVKERGSRAWRAARKLPILPTAVIGLFVIFAIFAPLLAPYDPTRIALPQKLTPPFFVAGGNTAYLLGTDALGRDVLSRLIWGARVSLTVSAAVVLLSSLFGLLIGLAAGYIGGRIDSLLMRFADGSMAFPGHSHCAAVCHQPRSRRLDRHPGRCQCLVGPATRVSSGVRCCVCGIWNSSSARASSAAHQLGSWRRICFQMSSTLGWC